MTNPYKNIQEEDVYTWPNPHFPFKCVLNEDKLRVFILENISHNYKWLKRYQDRIRPTDFFFVTLGWHLSKHLASQGYAILDQLNLHIENFFILYNSPEEKSNGEEAGLHGDVINHNAWIEAGVFTPLDVPKKYKALYVARPTDFKRHYLAEDIKGLALAAGGFNHRNRRAELPCAKNDPFKFLPKRELCRLMNESYCGLCLSREEGACYSSSEYLLSGIPVVSTKSKGGRDIWYNEYNSILCEDTPTAVAQAVEDCCSREWDSKLIRSLHLAQSHYYEKKLIAHLQRVVDKFCEIELDAAKIFKEKFNWYCNENSNACPHEDYLGELFK